MIPVPGATCCNFWVLSPYCRQVEGSSTSLRYRRSASGPQGMRSLISSSEPSSAMSSLPRLLVKSGGRISFLRSEDIDWIEAQGDYVRLHTNGKKHMVRDRISRLETVLPVQRFIRIHRSTIVNIDRIREMQPLSYGDYAVLLLDGTRLTLSRSFRQHVFRRLTSAA